MASLQNAAFEPKDDQALLARAMRRSRRANRATRAIYGERPVRHCCGASLNPGSECMRHIAISIVAAVAWRDGAVVSAGAETINVYDDHGGSVAEHDARWSELAARGANVWVVGRCHSACTVLLAHIPNERICVTPQASFGFHLAHRPDATATLWAGCNAGIGTA
jgi:hypothetical protein